jgi:hypothetical protein
LSSTKKHKTIISFSKYTLIQNNNTQQKK